MKWIFLSLMTLSYAFANIPFKDYDDHYLLAKLKPGEALPQSEHLLHARQLFGQVYALRSDNVEILQKDFQELGVFEYVQRNYKSSKHELAQPERESFEESMEPESKSSPFNDPSVGKVWSFNDREENGVSVNLAYQQLPSSDEQEEIIVAVVDTGVDFTHEDLKDVMWTNSKEIPGNGIDDDQNGYVDDVHGINTLARDSEDRPTGNIQDGHGHGTHVSGTIAATQNNKIGIAGIASKARIMGIRTVPNDGDETDINVVESFLYAAKHGARLINCSFGKDKNEGGMAVRDAMNHIAQEYDTLVVVAAGNSSRSIDYRATYPASFDSDNMLVVASSDRSGRRSFFSNYGIKHVDIAAPGSNIFSLMPRNRYASLSGTSMATPTTVGVAAEVLSRFPQLTSSQLKEVLMKSVTKSRLFEGVIVSGGRLDLLKALEMAQGL